MAPSSTCVCRPGGQEENQEGKGTGSTEVHQQAALMEPAVTWLC